MITTRYVDICKWVVRRIYPFELSKTTATTKYKLLSKRESTIENQFTFKMGCTCLLNMEIFNDLSWFVEYKKECTNILSCILNVGNI